VKKHAAERDAKGLTCWTQFVSMLFCQLGRADSLREICNGLGCCLGRLVHVGITRAPCRSTLSYANEHRPAALFEDLFFTALARFRDQQGLGARKHKFRFKNKLLSLDSTTISLCLTMFAWAKFRRAKGGVKAHVLLDHDDYMPAYVLLTEAKRSDVKLADSFPLNPGSIVAIDRGYIDYALFSRWSMAGVFFVTRLKDNAAFEVVAECEVPQNRNIRADQFIRLTGASTSLEASPWAPNTYFPTSRILQVSGIFFLFSSVALLSEQRRVVLGSESRLSPFRAAGFCIDTGLPDTSATRTKSTLPCQDMIAALPYFGSIILVAILVAMPFV
jgi:hypothetical protein